MSQMSVVRANGFLEGRAWREVHEKSERGENLSLCNLPTSQM